MVTRVDIALTDGRVLVAEADLGQPASDLDAQWQRLAGKFTAVAEPVIGPAKAAQIIARVAAFDQADDIGALMALAR
jgi:hypothetical protein